jgi:hypothetical protein
MKKPAFPFILTIIIIIYFSIPCFGGEKDSLYCIEIDGKVLIPKNDPSRTYKIELLCHNDIVDSGEVVDNESFLLKVKKNSWYTIRIVKEGYFPLIVSIDTRLPEYNTNSHRFHFDTELIVENYSGIQDRDAVDFPIALVSFNPNNDMFVPVREYSKNIKSALFDEQPQLKHTYVSVTGGK